MVAPITSTIKTSLRTISVAVVGFCLLCAFSDDQFSTGSTPTTAQPVNIANDVGAPLAHNKQTFTPSLKGYKNPRFQLEGSDALLPVELVFNRVLTKSLLVNIDVKNTSYKTYPSYLPRAPPLRA